MIIDKFFSEILNRAFREAQASQHEYFTPEHVFCTALEFEEVAQIISECGADASRIGEDLTTYITSCIPVNPEIKPQNESEEENSSIPDFFSPEPEPTVEMQKAFESAGLQCAASDRSEISVMDFLVSIYDAEKTYCSYSMKKNGIERLALIQAISSRKPLASDSNKLQNSEFEDMDFEDFSADFEGSNTSAKTSALEKYAKDITQKARNGELEPLVGRKEELERTIQILCRKTKNNPLHVGDAGVGKTAITEGLALKIAAGDVPDALKDFSIYSLEMSSVLAGAKFRGDFEDRLKKITDEILSKEKAILFIDEIHTIVGAGTTGNGTLDAANILKPVLTSGKVRCIGSTTFEEYKKVFEKDRALARRFQKIDILEPSPEDALKILKGLVPGYEKYHGVKYSPDALREAVDLSVQYLQDRRLPDKAIDIMDEAGAWARIYGKGGRVTATTVRRVAAKIARIPLETVSLGEKEKLKTLEQTISSGLFGQEQAVKAVCLAVKKSRAGFRNPDKPEASFLFAGPTGVGKTELAKMLAQTLGENLIRIDMSEYQEKHTVSRLIGSPPGYVGFEEGGLLTDAVRKDPHSVILLDEIEKAHHDIYNILLQVMDYGTLTDNTGRKSDFRNCILIMTSNAGARDMERSSLGFDSGMNEAASSAQAIKAAVEQEFTPEFRNRLDAIIPFNHLGMEVAKNIVLKEIALVQKRLSQRKVVLEVSPAAVEWLAQEGYSREYGARNIARTVEEKISSPLVDEILFGRASSPSGCKILVDLGTGSEVSFDFIPVGEKK